METDSESAQFGCNEDKKNPVQFKWKMGRRETTDGRPIYVPWSRDIGILLLGCTHIAQTLGKGKAQVGKIDAILKYSYLDTRIKRCTVLVLI